MVTIRSSRGCCVLTAMALLLLAGCSTVPPAGVETEATTMNPGPAGEDPAPRMEESVAVASAEVAPIPAEPEGRATEPGMATDGPVASETPEAPAAPQPASAVALAERASMMIGSTPTGAIVVVDGRPIGHAPLAISVPVTDRGFLSRPISVKVRFLAEDETRASQTTEVLLTPLDRAPLRLDFTPAGSRRTLGALDG